jgi:type I restriction enzyme S subunit
MPHVGGDNIESGTGRLIDLSTGRELGLISGKYLFGDEHVLYSKIRPNLNKVACPAFTGICSADIYPLRPVEGKLAREYLAHLLRSDDFLSYTTKHSTRTNIPKVNRESLLNYEAVVPPLPEQRRIAAVLDRAEALRAMRRTALARLDELTQAIFLEMFGDPKTNPSGWPNVPMRELFSAPPIFGSMVPPDSEKRAWLSLRVGNIQDWKLDLTDSKYIDLPPESIERHTVKDGDLLIARAIASQEHLGKCVVAYPREERWAFDSHLMRVRFDATRTLPEFVRHLLMTPGGRSLFLGVTRKSTVQYNVNTKELSGLRIPVPPINLQQRFARRVVAVEQLKSRHRASLGKLNELFAALQHRAFRGEL